MSKFENKTILVTGASSGIGLAMAKDFSIRGANLILTARSKDKLDQLAKELEAQGTKTKVFVEDISVPNSAQKLYDQIKTEQIDIDILVNNAGYGRWGTFDECPVGDYENMIHLNITSLTELSYLFLQDFEKKGSGGIINVASVAAFYSIPYSAVYAASKAFVSGITRSLVSELSPYNIRINAISPGTITTKFHEQYSTPEKLEATRLKIPMKRLGTAKDCVGPIIFLSSDAMSGYITGQILEINGGQFIS